MADRAKATRGRKRASGKGLPPPSAADLFDSLIQGQDKAAHDEPKSKKAKRVSSKATVIIASKSSATQEGEPDVSSEPVGEQADAATWQQSQNSQASSGGDNSNSPPAGSYDSEGSDDDGPVFMSFGGTLDKDSTASPEHSPRKPQRGRRPKLDTAVASTILTQDSPTKEVAGVLDNGQNQENQSGVEDDDSSKDDAVLASDGDRAAQGDTAAGLNQQKSRRSSDAGGVGSLGVSKDVEDSIRKEIENMLANNRFRGSGRGAGGDQETVEANGDVSVSLEEDVILVEAGRKKHCRFLIRRQEDQTPPSSRNYRCFKCSFNTTRMNNMIRHYRRC